VMPSAVRTPSNKRPGGVRGSAMHRLSLNRPIRCDDLAAEWARAATRTASAGDKGGVPYQRDDRGAEGRSASVAHRPDAAPARGRTRRPASPKWRSRERERPRRCCFRLPAQEAAVADRSAAGATRLHAGVDGPPGTKRGKGRGSFVADAKSATNAFCRELIQQLTTWRPKAPKLSDESEDIAEREGLPDPVATATPPGFMDEAGRDPGERLRIDRRFDGSLWAMPVTRCATCPFRTCRTCRPVSA
jgi:hypothetical protein